MSRKQCKRKVYKLISTINHAAVGAAISTPAALNKLRVQEVAAIEAFAGGTASLHDFEAAVALLNLCEYMVRNKVGPEALESCALLEAALRQAAADMEATGRMAMDAAGVQALSDVAAYHDLQRQSVHRSEYERAIFRTFERVKHKAPGVVEL